METSKPLVTNIFTNPIGWAGTMVGTKGRFLLSLIIFPVFVLLILDNLTDSRIIEHWSLALLLIAYQLMFLFSMRKLYERVESLEKSMD